jgi:hypothetical protein
VVFTAKAEETITPGKFCDGPKAPVREEFLFSPPYRRAIVVPSAQFGTCGSSDPNCYVSAK